MNGPLHSVAFGRELALLNRAFDKDVVAFIESKCDFGQVSVKRQAVPVGVLLRFAIRVLIAVALAEAGVGDGHSGWKIPDGGFGRQIADDFEPVSLHGLMSPFKVKFFQEAALHAGERLIARHGFSGS